jgi:hypothetical protein
MLLLRARIAPAYLFSPVNTSLLYHPYFIISRLKKAYWGGLYHFCLTLGALIDLIFTIRNCFNGNKQMSYSKEVMKDDEKGTSNFPDDPNSNPDGKYLRKFFSSSSPQRKHKQ